MEAEYPICYTLSAIRLGGRAMMGRPCGQAPHHAKVLALLAEALAILDRLDEGIPAAQISGVIEQLETKTRTSAHRLH
ncbi:hypothetical protein [uncultured Sphingomonas sp.]|uniref:hypothetical protein n=2 Tax=Sphingomonas TaxID=13687 RepID=UPI002594295C|nr:hypothetical protein [uncultured Sphingomonas sp.]